jgi:hypothetical protein
VVIAVIVMVPVTAPATYAHANADRNVVEQAARVLAVHFAVIEHLLVVP